MCLLYSLASTVVIRSNFDDTSQCPKCQYKFILYGTKKFVACGECNHVACRHCHEDSHKGKTCQQVAKDKVELARKEEQQKKDEESGKARLVHRVAEAMTEAVLRKCPKCKIPYQKEIGCNKIICPGCKAFSCHLCQKQISNTKPYEHFCQTPHCNHTSCGKCNLWENINLAKEREQAGLKAEDEIGVDSGLLGNGKKKRKNGDAKRLPAKKRPRNH